MNNKISIGISSCLLGEKVRYDGGHKLDHYLKDTLGAYVEWVPVCPDGRDRFAGLAGGDETGEHRKNRK